LFAEAEPVAGRVLRSKETSSKVILLADVVKIMAEVGRGAYEESLASLTSALDASDGARAGPGAALPQALPLTARLTLLDAYFQRLSQGDQFAVAGSLRPGATEPPIQGSLPRRFATGPAPTWSAPRLRSPAPM
jgi:hypothetical protein